MQSLTFSSNLIFTRLHARISQEEGAFTVSVQLLKAGGNGMGTRNRDLD